VSAGVDRRDEVGPGQVLDLAVLAGHVQAGLAAKVDLLAAHEAVDGVECDPGLRADSALTAWTERTIAWFTPAVMRLPMLVERRKKRHDEALHLERRLLVAELQRRDRDEDLGRGEDEVREDLPPRADDVTRLDLRLDAPDDDEARRDCEEADRDLRSGVILKTFPTSGR